MNAEIELLDTDCMDSCIYQYWRKMEPNERFTGAWKIDESKKLWLEVEKVTTKKRLFRKEVTGIELFWASEKAIRIADIFD